MVNNLNLIYLVFLYVTNKTKRNYKKFRRRSTPVDEGLSNIRKFRINIL
jgi:hypothetical protein